LPFCCTRVYKGGARRRAHCVFTHTMPFMTNENVDKLVGQGGKGSDASNDTQPYEDPTLSIYEMIAKLEKMASKVLPDIAEVDRCADASARAGVALRESDAAVKAEAASSYLVLRESDARLQEARSFTCKGVVQLAEAICHEGRLNYSDSQMPSDMTDPYKHPKAPRGAVRAAYESRVVALDTLVIALETERDALRVLRAAHAIPAFRVRHVTSERRKVSSLLRALKGTYHHVCKHRAQKLAEINAHYR